MSFRCSTADDAEQLGTLLKACLSSAAPDEFSTHRMMWKYWEPHADWSGSRSFVDETEGSIVAHCAVVPLKQEEAGGTSVAAHFYDWAANPRAPGSGVRLVRNVLRTVGTLLAVGGSNHTRKILPRIGFRASNQVTAFVRPLRPLLIAQEQRHPDWKLPLRTMRNTLRTWTRPVRVPAGWSYSVAQPENIYPALWSPSQSGLKARKRTASFLKYFLACPFVRFRLYEIHQDGKPAGCMVLGFAQRQVRIVDLWLREESLDGYIAMYQVAMCAALEEPAAGEVVTISSNAIRSQAIGLCGFSEVWQEPLMALGSETASFEYDCQLIDSDNAFLGSDTPDYMT